MRWDNNIGIHLEHVDSTCQMWEGHCISMFQKILSFKEKFMSHKILSLKKKFIYYKIKIYHMAGVYLCLEADVEIFIKCLTKESNT